jgi:pyridoxamine 5'-phosphate oxidase
MAMADLRRDYQADSLERAQLASDPLQQFQQWFGVATGAVAGSRWRRISIAFYKLWQAFRGFSPPDANAMTLSTVDELGRPSSRTVLLKGQDARGFIFFTNYTSRKGAELAANSNAALTFFWPELERQVCIAGTVTRIPVAESAEYFHSRPRGSQVSAWASSQSAVVENRAALERRWKEIEAQFPGEIPLPPHWGGYVLAPVRIEFWQGRASRLHDRFCYSKQPDASWKMDRLSP